MAEDPDHSNTFEKEDDIPMTMAIIDVVEKDGTAP